MQKTIPAISIVIPMYNSEKYIGECLDSILTQTFTDFEVIVIDDCSTDNSCAIVESYLPKFNRQEIDKLRLIRREVNSGSAGTPRDIGISLSRGEYLSCIDSDDMITETALEELYSIAKEFDADVVHCERYIQFTDNSPVPTLEGYQTGELVKEPTLITEDLSERVKEMYDRRFLWNLWSKLIRRDVILENNIKAIDGMGQDCLITCCLVCSAKRYVRVPNIINFYRINPTSVTNRNDDIPKKIQKRMSELKNGFQVFDKFLSTRKFFLEHPDIKHLALEVWVREICGYIKNIYAQFPAWQLDPIIRHEMENLNDKNNLMAFLFARMNVFNLQISQQGNIINQMNAHIQQQNQVIRQLQAQLKN